MRRSRVVLPQPEGPNRKKSSCGSTSSDTSRRAGVWPKLLLMFLTRTRMSVQGDATVLLFGPGLPLNLFAISNRRLFPVAFRQGQGIAFTERRATQLVDGFGGKPACNELPPRAAKVIMRVHEERTRQRGHNLASFPADACVVKKALPQIEGRELDVA